MGVTNASVHCAVACFVSFLSECHCNPMMDICSNFFFSYAALCNWLNFNLEEHSYFYAPFFQEIVVQLLYRFAILSLIQGRLADLGDGCVKIWKNC